MKKRVNPAKIIDEIQVSLAEIKLELRTYSVLFQSLGTASLNTEDLVGLSLIFNRVTGQIDETNRQLNKVYASDYEIIL